MNENASPESTHNVGPQSHRQLSWEDRPHCFGVISAGSPTCAIVFVDGREQFVLVLLHRTERGVFKVGFTHVAVPERALVALGRTIVAHLATAPEVEEVL